MTDKLKREIKKKISDANREIAKQSAILAKLGLSHKAADANSCNQIITQRKIEKRVLEELLSVCK